MENKESYFESQFVDYKERSGERDRIALAKAKKLEEKYKDRLVRVDIPGGYVMTTRPDDFKHLAIKKDGK